MSFNNEVLLHTYYKRRDKNNHLPRWGSLSKNRIIISEKSLQRIHRNYTKRLEHRKYKWRYTGKKIIDMTQLEDEI